MNDDETAKKLTATKRGDKKGSGIQDRSGGATDTRIGAGPPWLTVLPGAACPAPSPQRKRGVQLALNPLIQEAVRRGGIQSSEPQAFLPGLSKPRKCGTGEKKKHRFIKGKRCDGSCYHRPLTCGRRFLSGGGEIVLLL